MNREFIKDVQKRFALILDIHDIIKYRINNKEIKLSKEEISDFSKMIEYFHKLKEKYEKFGKNQTQENYLELKELYNNYEEYDFVKKYYIPYKESNAILTSENKKEENIEEQPEESVEEQPEESVEEQPEEKKDNESSLQKDKKYKVKEKISKVSKDINKAGGTVAKGAIDLLRLFLCFLSLCSIGMTLKGLASTIGSLINGSGLFKNIIGTGVYGALSTFLVKGTLGISKFRYALEMDKEGLKKFTEEQKESKLKKK